MSTRLPMWVSVSHQQPSSTTSRVGTLPAKEERQARSKADSDTAESEEPQQ